MHHSEAPVVIGGDWMGLHVFGAEHAHLVTGDFEGANPETTNKGRTWGDFVYENSSCMTDPSRIAEMSEVLLKNGAGLRTKGQ